MKYVISFYNQTAAGPQNLASTFLAVLERDAAAADDYFVFFPKIEIYSKLFGPRRGRIKIFFIPHFAFGNQMLSILIYDFLMLPFIVALINPKVVLIFGSLAPVPFFFKKKITLVHHPYLVDDGLLASLGPGRRLVENAKRFIFYLTAKAGGIFVVETENMKQNLTRKYGIRQDLINVIGNSVGETFYRECSGSRAAFSPAPPRRNYLFYPSRFNRHKNHRFIMEIARDFSPYFESNGLKFYITVDGGADKEAENYLRAVKAAGLDKIIVNLGEMPNEKLCAYYRGALGLFFPSKSETFGIPLLEAMAFGLPVIVPDLPYAHDVCGSAGWYYPPGDTGAAFAKIKFLYQDEAKREELAKMSRARFLEFPTPHDWVCRYLSLIRNS